MVFNSHLRPCVHCYLSAQQVLALLPDNKPLKYLLTRRTLDGRFMCPVGMYNMSGLARVLEWEADMDKWGLMPFAGTSGDWPTDAYDVLRHVRIVRGQLQAERYRPKKD